MSTCLQFSCPWETEHFTYAHSQPTIFKITPCHELVHGSDVTAQDQEKGKKFGNSNSDLLFGLHISSLGISVLLMQNGELTWGLLYSMPKRFASPGMECAIENIENRHHHLHDYWRCMKHTLWDARCKTFLWSGCRWCFKHDTESKPLIQHHKPWLQITQLSADSEAHEV